jgi:hypothetical protein
MLWFAFRIFSLGKIKLDLKRDKIFSEVGAINYDNKEEE